VSSGHSPAKQLAALAVAQLFAMTLWFSATAVLGDLAVRFSLGSSGAAWMTAAVQLGFVAGALLSAILSLPDVISPRRLVAVSAGLGALANLLLAYVAKDAWLAILLRFVTGLALAGVYPPGMKIASGHVSSRRRGLAIGVLVGALTLGSAAPHLIAALGADLPHRVVLAVSSGLALLGALIMVVIVRDGPHSPKTAPFDPRQIGRVLRNRPVLLANLGYIGHMWELYAMWAWLAVFLSAATVGEPRLVVFFAIGVAGAVGAVAAGVLADRLGRTLITSISMIVSGVCCILVAVVFSAPGPVLITVVLIWGVTIVADSAQFSAAVTELTEPEYMGTALTLQTSLGFAVTLIPIWGMPYLAEAIGWQYAFAILALGPVAGTVSMLKLRRHPEAVKMAAGNR